VPAALLTAVDSTRMHPGVALAANQLVLLVLTSQCQQRWVNNSSSQAQHQVQGGLCQAMGVTASEKCQQFLDESQLLCGLTRQPLTLLDVVVLQGAAILELLASKDKTLLVRRDAFLVLDFSFNSFDGVGALHLEGDGLSRQGFHKDLQRNSVRVERRGEKTTRRTGWQVSHCAV